MRFILASIMAAVVTVMAFANTGCATGQFVSDEVLADMEPENRAKYYQGLEITDRAADAVKEAVKAAKEAYEKTYDPVTGEPLEPVAPEADPVE